MGAQTEKLSTALGFGTHEMVSITGGGGKTSLAFLLADELAVVGQSALVTTTTHMGYPHGFDGAVVVDQHIESVVGALRAPGVSKAFAVAHSEPNGKMKGFSSQEVDTLFGMLPDFTFLNESDGAAMKPYKFYRDYEPVIPSSTTILIQVIGCEVYGSTMSGLLFHRCPDNRTGQIFDEAALHRELAWFAQHKLANFTGRRILVVNKADQGRREQAARMCNIGKAYFDLCLASSLHEGTWWMP